MTEITRGNWSFRDPGDDISSGDTISGGNFSQLVPNTAILVGKTLTITGGTWGNVAVQPEWTVTGGVWLQISRCANLHPELVAKGLPSEDENCIHVVDTDQIYIDGELVDTVYHYQDTVQ